MYVVLVDQHHHVQEVDEHPHHHVRPFDEAAIAANEAVLTIENNQEEEEEEEEEELEQVIFLV